MTFARISLAGGLLVLAGGLALLGADPSVLTPAGAMPRAQVVLVEEGEALREIDGAMRKVNAATGAPLDAVPALGAERVLDDGWVTFTFWKNDTGAPLTSFSSAWRVPEPPKGRHRQTLFLFNGLQNSGPNYGILQPVLQWGVSAAGGGDYWSVASWYVTSRGQAFHTPLVRVAPGTLLVGEMTLVGEARGKRSYTSEVRDVPRTRLLLQNVAELKWSTESLEAYGVTRCADYPASTEVPFTAIRLVTDVHPSLRWSVVDRITDCDQHAHVVSHSSVDGQVDLRLDPGGRR
jgi:hypothetical protein